MSLLKYKYSISCLYVDVLSLLCRHRSKGELSRFLVRLWRHKILREIHHGLGEASYICLEFVS